jgi:hypothetical protein
MKYGGRGLRECLYGFISILLTGVFNPAYSKGSSAVTGVFDLASHSSISIIKVQIFIENYRDSKRGMEASFL